MDQSITGRLAEQGVLAGIFDNPEDLDLVSGILTPEDFQEPRNSIIFATMQKLHNDGKSFDPVSVATHLEHNGQLNKVGGIDYFQHLIDPETLYAYDTDVIGYSFFVKENSQVRQVKALSRRLDEYTRPDSGKTAEEILSLAEDDIREIADVIISSDATPAGDIISSVLDSIAERGQTPEGATLGVPSGFVDLDNKTTGWKGGQFILIAARPGQGKTTIALDLARAASLKAGLTAMFFSLEMSKEEIMEKVISAEARVESDKIKKGKLSPSEWESVHRVAGELQKSHLIIDDSAKITIPHIRAAAIKQKARPEGLDILFLDYIQLLSSPTKVESRQLEVSEFSRNLKLLAKELDIPVIALSQLNRGPEQRQDKAPQISDLRESGSLEQDADIIMLLHRPEYYDPNDRPGQAILNLAKHRGGETDVITLIPLLQYSKFANGAGLIAVPPDVAGPPDGDAGVPDEPPADLPPDPPEDPYSSMPPAGYDEEVAVAPGPAW